MADEKHLLLQVSGSYSPTPLAEEIWEVTLRCALVAGAVDNSGTLPDTLGVIDDDINRTETDWTISGNWQIASSVPPANFNVDDWLNDQVAPAFIDWLGATNISSGARMNTIKASIIGSPLGRSVPPPSQSQGSPILLTFTGTLPTGGGAATQLPAQVSIVASHVTSQTGRKGRGRMYLPAVSNTPLSSGGILGSSGVTAVNTAQVALLEDVAFSGTGGNPWNVRPIVTGKPFVKYGVIQNVRTGKVYDTQQRRKNAMDEAYTSADVTY